MNEQPHYMRRESIPVPQPGYQIEEVDGEVLMFNAATAETVYLNRSAGVVWYLCNGERTIGSIVDLVSEYYGETDQEIIEDVKSILRQYSDIGCIRMGEFAGTPKISAT
jgi:hypothetical protein